ncbi:Nif3-like dinuclear metal center hexameric protein [Nanoarchaeota archaeon]
MVSLNEITKFLDRELAIDSMEDFSYNGLQVGQNRPIRKIGFAVDACMETFRKAKKEGCDLLITHHGLLWKGDMEKTRLTKYNYTRTKFLIENKIALYAAHLPLDKHPKWGNNVQLLKLIGATPNTRPGAEFGKVGYAGSFKRPKKVKDVVVTLNKKLNARCQIMKYGKDSVKTVACVTGAGQYDAFEAINKGIDLYIAGEIGHTILHPVKESKLNVIGAGHYATEILGVKALMPILKKKFRISTEFLDTPTGL